MNINWYPGHMTKTKRALADKLKLIDLVVEVIDARAPGASRNPDFEAMFEGKTRMLILNKSDMADEAVTRSWIQYFEGQGIKAVSYSAVQGNAQRLRQEIERCAEPIYEKYRKKGMKKTVRCLVCGIPNVGKSAILNRLVGGKKLKEGNKPGVTRGLSWVRLTPYLEMMDSPGLLWPKIEDEQAGAIIAFIGSIRTEILNEEELAWHLLEKLKHTAPGLLMERYRLETLPEEPWEIMAAICQKRGFLMKQGEINYERGTQMLLEEFKNAKLGRISLELPPDRTEA